MSECSHKRKRSLQDSRVDLSKMRMALNRLDALKEELEGIEETEEEMQSISDHVLVLENILRGAKKPRVTFSTIIFEDLKRAGVRRKRLVFKHSKVAELAKRLTGNVETQIVDLYSRIKKIYAYVNMDYEPGSRMILDAILITLAEIASTEQRGVAILPEMRIAQGDGVQIAHPDSGYELWLSGYVDYAVIEYDNDSEGDHKARLLNPGSSRDDAFDISKGRLFLVEAKRQSLERVLTSFIPEAVSQAIALLKSENLPELENGTLTYYESPTQQLSRDILEASDMPLRQIVLLIREWLKPTEADLFKLE